MKRTENTAVAGNCVHAVHGSDRAIDGKLDWGASLLAEYGIPAHFHGGLERYLKHGIPTGGFLYAVLTNNLIDAVFRADSPATMFAIRPVVRFLRMEASANAWGSPDAVKDWIERKAEARRRAAENAGDRGGESW